MTGSVYAIDLEQQAANKRRVMALLDRHPFRPAWWLGHRHLQTCWGPLARTRPPVPFERERVETPDEDFLDLYSCHGDPEKPWVVLLHGLEGTLQSFYISTITAAFHQIGWNVMTMMFRGCSGEMNRAQRIYHMGETTDVAYVVELIGKRHPGAAIYLTGISLGANVIVKWLGESGENLPPSLRGAASISPPFDPARSTVQFHREFFGLYAKKFLRTLIPKAVEKERQYPGCIDIEKVRNCRNFQVYDTEVTARIHGFADAEDYWKRVGCGQFVSGIRLPTLLLTSRDDPFNPADTIPAAQAEASHWLHPQWTDHGGHVGFVSGPPLKPVYWMEDQIVRFCMACEANCQEQKGQA